MAAAVLERLNLGHRKRRLLATCAAGLLFLYATMNMVHHMLERSYPRVHATGAPTSPPGAPPPLTSALSSAVSPLSVLLMLVPMRLVSAGCLPSRRSCSFASCCELCIMSLARCFAASVIRKIPPTFLLQVLRLLHGCSHLGDDLKLVAYAMVAMGLEEIACDPEDIGLTNVPAPEAPPFMSAMVEDAYPNGFDSVVVE